MEKLRIGLIGVGGISSLHAQGYKDNPTAEMYAVCDINAELLQRRAREWGAQQAYTDYRQLLADPKVDAVEVITPHHLHVGIGVAALEAGKHVSMQKPMAMNVTECDALIEAARRSGKLFRVLENFRYYPPLVRAKELLDSGAIGEPLSIRIKIVQGSMGKGWKVPYSRWAWRFDETKSGGGRIMFDYGSHFFAIAMWLLGEVEKVYSWITYRPIRPELAKRGVSLIRGVDHVVGAAGGGNEEVAAPDEWLIDSPAVAIWKYKNAEKYGTFEVVTSYDIQVPSKYTPEDEWVELTGSRGFIWVTRCTSNLLDRPPVVMYRDGVTTEFSDMETDWGASFIAGLHDFTDGIIRGRQPALTGEEGKVVLQICRAAQLSAKEGREVRPEEIR
ncbi:MAG: Gfo/Idh/MocA family oxidoreductase [candidate division NC10 bacterium]|nr:Gfo/Idh/MocA family oxidoreductase [candidate division NC10 bacterium]